jgi:flagellin
MASSDIVLSAALRNNLLSLQGTQRSIDSTQLRLATGLKINSALDGPQQFFTAQSLNNRAGDLSRLLDGLALSIQTITEADKGVSALTKLVEQADSITASARDELAGSVKEARIVSKADLSDVANITTLGNGTTVLGTEVFTFTTTDDAGNRISRNVTLGGGRIENFAANITDTFADDENGEIIATVTDGRLAIRSKDGRSFKITAADAAGTGDINAGLTLLGLNEYFALETRSLTAPAALNRTVRAATVVAGNTVSTVSLYEGAGDLVEAGDAINSNAGYTNANGQTVLKDVSGLNFAIDIDGTLTTVGNVTGTFQQFVDGINSNTTINPHIKAEFDTKTGQLRFTSLSDSVRTIQVIATTIAPGAGPPVTAPVASLGLGGDVDLDPISAGSFTKINGTQAATTYTVAGGVQDFVVKFNSSTAALDSYAKDFNKIREQIDALVEDASFKGINLLNGDDLVTFFNETNINSLKTDGEVFTAAGLGILEATFRTSTEIESTASQIRGALGSVRSFGASLSNSLAILQTRRDFTNETINTLRAGAGDLTNADQNEEGANLLALQTRQQLGVTALSLAAQSQQSVLRLF